MQALPGECKGRSPRASPALLNFIAASFLQRIICSSMTTNKIFRHNTPEILFFVVVWAFVLVVPLFQEAYDYSTGMTEQFDWKSLAYDYFAYLPFIVIFLLTKFIYEPKLFFRGKIKAFFAVALLSTLILTFAFSFVAPERHHRHRMQRVEWKMEDPDHPHTMAPPPDLPLPHKGDPRPGIAAPDPRQIPLTLRILRGPFFPMLLMSLMMCAGSLGVAIIFRNRRDQIENKEKQAALLQSELDYLKYQINPHFFMNTLNNIHALVDIDSESAKEAIIQLSRMMRYLLYESNQPTVPMRKELSFIRQYLDLMRLRCDESVTLTYKEPGDECMSLDVGVPPMMFISFVENAFKHGISHKEQSYIDIAVSQEEDRFHFHCANSNFAKEDSIQQGGVGLDNVQKRLDLIYPGRYTLNIVPSEHDFTVDLWLPIS